MDVKQLYRQYGKQMVITTDSRFCPEGSIFIALKGENFDGNRYAAQALEKGCRHAIVDNPDFYDAQDGRYLLVDDTLQAYKQLAREYRREFDIPMIGITGTNGKTTTKELIATVLKQKYRVMATEGNFNNDVGVPKTLMRLSDEYEIAVVEMGASHPGDIRTLVNTAEPTCGIITNVGLAHLQGFGSFEGVKRTKGELYDFFAQRKSLSPIFINAQDKDLMQMLEERMALDDNKIEPIYYSTERLDIQKPYVFGKAVEANPFLCVQWNTVDEHGNDGPKHSVRSQLIGQYNIHNILAAVAIGLHFGVDPDDMSTALEQYQPSNNRSQYVDTGRNHLIVDAYNANLSSMMASMDNFDTLMKADRKMVILGDMKELGTASTDAHQQIVDRLKQMDVQVWLVGEEFNKTQHGDDCRMFDNVEQVMAAVAEQPIDGYTILIKGSHSMRLDKLKDVF